ncbi:dipeptidase PepE [Polaribacter sp. PL03]|uniref:dipeptidase PepE n=1 Tax=Polaribacter sp. PL03 TaxID=3088353 RepID=UPI0029D08624|nr:dipeptidase PepE [Polaribacter sp. PL03]MDX6745813.1 dipeptidase PepE [Polaribacter sp. PL03]
MKKMIIASTSTVFGSGYLEYLLPILQEHFKDVKTLLFIPYARPGGISYDAYTSIAKKAFTKINIDVKGIHEYEDAKEAILNAEAIFTGGGNTFELVNQIYKNDILTVLKDVLEIGTPYLGTSAGSNICGVNMMNTNDMPIVYPPSFTTLGCIPFNINAHYLDPIDGSKHMGETRETRIKEFHVFNDTAVLGLREGSWLSVEGDKITLQGKFTARLFKQNTQPIELESGEVVNC